MSKLKSAIGLILNSNKISNASIAIIQDGFDFRDTLREDNGPQSDKSKYLIYSIAKVYIAALIMRLSDQKRIEIDNPVDSWFPEIQGLDGITVRHLLNHHSGMPDYGPTRAYLKAIIEHPLQPWSFEEYVNNTLQKGLLSPPGLKFYYSNLGHAFLKRIIEKVSGLEFGVCLTETLLKPLGLNETVMLNTAEDLAQVIPAMSYSVIPQGKAVDMRSHYHPGWVAHGLMASTAGDIARFLDYLFKGEIVSGAALNTMLLTRPVTFQSPHFERPGYGLGLMTADLSHGRIYGHTGGGPGFMAVGYHLKSVKPLTIAILTNNEMAFSLEKAMTEIIGLFQN